MALIGLENVKKAMANLKVSANDDLRAIYINGLGNIQKQTPVDEGRARNNWFLSVGTPSTKTTSSTGSPNTSQITSMTRNVLGKKILFTNNLPYIGLLEYGGYPQPGTSKTISGFSSQAPNGWVRATLIKMANKIRNL